jgi:hypothetical protein
MDIAIVSVAGLILLGGFIAAIVGRKSWPIYTILLVVINLLAAVGCWFLTTRTLKMKLVWGKEYEMWEKEVNTINRDWDDLRIGKQDAELDPNNFETLGVADLRRDLRIATQRTNAWGIVGEGFKPQNAEPIVATIAVNGNKITGTVDFKTEQPPVGLNEGKLVYIFFNTSAIKNQDLKINENMYLGRYIIKKFAGKSLEVERLEPVLPGLDENVGCNNQSVILYEDFPTDNYTTFASLRDIKLEDLLANAPDYLKKQYLEHGKVLTEEEANALVKASDLPENAQPAEREVIEGIPQFQVFTRVKMLKETKLADVSIAPPKKPAANLDGVEVVEPSLYVGQVLIVDQATAKDWIEKGLAANDGQDYRIYRRLLNDFPQINRTTRAWMEVLDQEIAERKRLISLSEIAAKSAQDELAAQAAMLAKLNQDTEQLNSEKKIWDTYQEQLKDQISKVRAYHNQLLSSIKQYNSELTRLQFEAARRVNARIQAQEQAAVEK